MIQLFILEYDERQFKYNILKNILANIVKFPIWGGRMKNDDREKILAPDSRDGSVNSSSTCNL